MQRLLPLSRQMCLAPGHQCDHLATCATRAGCSHSCVLLCSVECARTTHRRQGWSLARLILHTMVYQASHLTPSYPCTMSACQWPRALPQHFLVDLFFWLWRRGWLLGDAGLFWVRKTCCRLWLPPGFGRPRVEYRPLACGGPWAHVTWWKAKVIFVANRVRLSQPGTASGQHVGAVVAPLCGIWGRGESMSCTLLLCYESCCLRRRHGE